MDKVLVLGKNGQLGQEFVALLKKQNKKFIAYSREELDIKDNKKLEIIIEQNQPSVIINTTAYHVTADCEKFPLEAFRLNCVVVNNLATISKKVGAKFITYSTNYVFDGEKKKPYEEKDITNPLQMYGLSKLAGEIASLNEYPEGTYIVRTCSVFGGGRNGSRSKKGNYILKILNEAKRNKEIYASKKQIVNPTYAGHLASATNKLIDSNAKPGIYHLVSEGNISWYDFAKKIVENSNIKNVEVKEFKNNEENKNFKSPESSALLNTKAKKLGVVLPTVEKGLKDYLKTL